MYIIFSNVFEEKGSYGCVKWINFNVCMYVCMYNETTRECEKAQRCARNIAAKIKVASHSISWNLKANASHSKFIRSSFLVIRECKRCMPTLNIILLIKPRFETCMQKSLKWISNICMHYVL